MFACFGLKRMDVFSTGDLGVQLVFSPILCHDAPISACCNDMMLACTIFYVYQLIMTRRRGIATYLGKNVSKLKGKGGKWKFCTEAEMLDIASRFSPYR